MRIVLSNHANKRVKERNLKIEEVYETINSPDYTIKRSKGDIESYKKIKERTLKVVYIKRENYINVITAYYLS